MRSLLVLPIIHSLSELGSLASTVREIKSSALGETRAAEIAESVELFWHQLGAAIDRMELDYQNVLVYQDGLPVIENASLGLERKIVDDLASNGSPNHRLVQTLLNRGACLVGTESAELLMREYHAIRQHLLSGFRESSAALGTAEGALSVSDGAQEQLSVLRLRDQFIARRIDETLGSEQLGLLFIGMQHSVEHYLPDSISVQYPIGQPLNKQNLILDKSATT